MEAGGGLFWHQVFPLCSWLDGDIWELDCCFGCSDGEETEKISAIAWKCVYTTYAHVRIHSLQSLAGCGPPALCEIEAVHRNLQKVLLQGHSGACHQPYQQKEKNQYSFFGSNYPSQYGYPLPIEVAGIFSFFQFPGPYAASSFRPAF